jgi:hypothetical protein
MGPHLRRKSLFLRKSRCPPEEDEELENSRSRKAKIVESDFKRDEPRRFLRYLVF